MSGNVNPTASHIIPQNSSHELFNIYNCELQGGSAAISSFLSTYSPMLGKRFR